VRRTDRLTSKPQPLRAKAQWDRGCALHDGRVPSCAARPVSQPRWESAVRSAGIVAACVGLTLLVGGCDLNDRNYFRGGIGTDLYTADIASATELQNIYLDNLCRQSEPYVGAAVPSCAPQAVSASNWPVIVQAGLNDIDTRCDSYLAWLDQKRRENAGILTEIGAVRFAVDALTNPAVVTVSPVALAAISAAFGLATSTVNNFNSLLLQVDHTTVQSVVFVNRRVFRQNLLQLSTAINNKPTAIHALRSYLTICMPMTISANINSTVTVFQQAGPNAIDKQQLVSTSTISDVRRQLPSDGFHRDFGQERFNLLLDTSLCVPQTRQSRQLAIRDYLVGQNQLQDPNVTSVTITPALQRRLNQAVAKVSDCRAAGFENAFEVGRYGVYDPEKRKANVNSLQEALRTKLHLSKRDLPDSDDLDQATRDQIAKFRKARDLEVALQGQVSNRLLVELRKSDSQ
jgi:hypothetical protein